MITVTLREQKPTDIQYTVYLPNGSHEVMFARRQVIEGEEVNTESYPFTAASVTPGVIVLQNIALPSLIPDRPEFSIQD